MPKNRIVVDKNRKRNVKRKFRIGTRKNASAAMQMTVTSLQKEARVGRGRDKVKARTELSRRNVPVET